MIAAKPIRSNRIRRSMPERIFGVCNNVLLVCLAFVCLYPMLYVVFASFSNATALSMAHGFLWRPAGFSLGGYKLVFENPSFLTGYYNTFIYVFGGTAINLFLSSLGAYVLSRKHGWAAAGPRCRFRKPSWRTTAIIWPKRRPKMCISPI